MVKIELFGTPQCRRYKKMRKAVLKAAVELGLEIELEEFNDTGNLSHSNPLDLLRLYLNGELVAVRNPPKSTTLVEQMHTTSIQS